MKPFITPVLVVTALLAASPAAAQFVSEADQAERAEAMAKLAFMHGEWVGPASGVNADRSTYEVTQTERIGPMLDGDILVIEGKGYEADGSVGFNAFAVISYDTGEDAYEIRSYAMDMAGTFPLTLTDTGYVWEVPAGPGKVRYTATIHGDSFREVGEYVMPTGQAWPNFEMTLTRRGDTDWPSAGAVRP